MSDEFPRPYAEEPPTPEPLSGLRLLRARPWAVAGTVLLTFVLTVAYPMTTDALVRFLGYEYTMTPWLPMLALAAVPSAVTLTVVAVLGRRRVTVGRALGLLLLTMFLYLLQSLLVSALAGPFVPVDSRAMEVLGWVVEVLTLIALGAVGASVFPPVVGRSDVRMLLSASVVVGVLGIVESWVRVPDLSPWPWKWALVGAVIEVGWAIAVLVTSRPTTRAWAVTPADLGRQDP